MVRSEDFQSSDPSSTLGRVTMTMTVSPISYLYSLDELSFEYMLLEWFDAEGISLKSFGSCSYFYEYDILHDSVIITCTLPSVRRFDSP